MNGSNTESDFTRDRFDALTRGAQTFTPDRLHAILAKERKTYLTDPKIQSRIRSNRGPSIDCQVEADNFWREDRGDGQIRWYSQPYAMRRVENFCQGLFEQKSCDSISVSHLDSLYSSVFQFRFEPLDQPHEIVESACKLLERMPARPPELVDFSDKVPKKYRAQSFYATYSDKKVLWEQLQVANYVNSVVLRCALMAVMIPYASLSISQVTEVTAALLETVSRLSSTISNVKTAWRAYVVRAFLWNSWQRLQMLYFHLIAVHSMDKGALDGKKQRLTLRGPFPAPNVSLDEMSERYASLEKAAYMCGWNFELLRTNPVCMGFDFHRFHQRYRATFGSLPGRCLSGYSDACKGESPETCQRFRGMVVKDQSAHNQSCPSGCAQLIWDEESYRSLSGARAVSLVGQECLSQGKVQFCTTSNRTLAISHVWSHGQGGRPETGFNSCLHFRYCQVARSLGCDSYWIDAICIPQSHELRQEAIENINQVFMNAKIVLICDKDIMQIDASGLTIAICETLFVTLLVSDWNVRAWTFLEAFRGRRSLHLLCKNNIIVPLIQIIQKIHVEGAMEIGMLLLTSPHFLIPFDDHKLAKTSNWNGPSFQAGFLSPEASSNLLNYRPASRPGDDIVIWSLLVSDKTIFYDAQAFWTSLQGEVYDPTDQREGLDPGASINLTCLISDIPRLPIRGLGWAPMSPTLQSRPRRDQGGPSSYEEYPVIGNITYDGLVAHWRIWTFTNPDSDNDSRSKKASAPKSKSQFPQNLSRIRKRFLHGYARGAILMLPEMPGHERWEVDGNSKRMRYRLVVICGTGPAQVGESMERYTRSLEAGNVRLNKHRDSVAWEWKGVYAWDDREPMPEWGEVWTLLIV